MHAWLVLPLDHGDAFPDGEDDLLDAIVVLNGRVELMQLLPAYVIVVVEQGAEGIVRHDEAVLGQEPPVQGQLVIGEVVLFVRVQED